MGNQQIKSSEYTVYSLEFNVCSSEPDGSIQRFPSLNQKYYAEEDPSGSILYNLQSSYGLRGKLVISNEDELFEVFKNYGVDEQPIASKNGEVFGVASYENFKFYDRRKPHVFMNFTESLIVMLLYFEKEGKRAFLFLSIPFDGECNTVFVYGELKGFYILKGFSTICENIFVCETENSGLQLYDFTNKQTKMSEQITPNRICDEDYGCLEFNEEKLRPAHFRLTHQTIKSFN